MARSNWMKMGASLATALVLTACGGGGGGGGGFPIVAPTTTTPTANAYSFGGTVSGLAAGGNIAVSFNGTPALTVTANGPYSFVPTLAANASYSVTISQPAGQTCSVANFSGAGATANVTNINIVCATNAYAIGGTVSGLAAGQQVTLSNNGADPLVVTADGAIRFAQAVPFNGSFLVAVQLQPAGQTCTVANASNSGVNANVTSVAVSCSAIRYFIGGTATGLDVGEQVTLSNGGEFLIVHGAPSGTTNSFQFLTPVNFGGSYNVSVAPLAGKTCTVGNGTGSSLADNVTNIQLTCTVVNHGIGGAVRGATGPLTLKINGLADAAVISGNGAFTLLTPVADGANYLVDIGTPPAGQTCVVSDGSGTAMADVSNVDVSCSPTVFTIGGVVTGLADGISLTLRNRGGDTFTIVGTSTGALQTFAFPTSLVAGEFFAVTPGDGQCVVDNAGGVVGAANVTSVAVHCESRAAYAYTANYKSNTVSQYTLQSGGSLAPMATASVGAGVNPYYVAVDATRSYAFVTSRGDNLISQYKIALDGSLAANAVVSVSTGTAVPIEMAMHPTMPFAYVATADSISGDTSILQFSIDGSGNLVPLATASVPTGAVSLAGIAIDRSGRFVYVTDNSNGSIRQFAVDGATGALTAALGGTLATGATDANELTFDPSGRFAYLTDRTGNKVFQFTVASDGLLAPLGSPIATGLDQPIRVSVDPTGRFAYVVNIGGIKQVSQYTIGATGELAEIAGAVSTGSSYGFTLDPTGSFAYSPVFNLDQVYLFGLDATSGAASFLNPYPTLPANPTVDEPLNMTIITAR